MDRQLRTFSATLEAWLQVQKGWVALEAVFGAADIQRQLPAEARAFAQVDKTFKDIMRRAHDRPNALQVSAAVGSDSLSRFFGSGTLCILCWVSCSDALGMRTRVC
jgi:hypothetical protein